MSDWLQDFNDAAQLTNEGQLERAASRYADVAQRLTDDPTVTAKFHHMLALRRADVAGRLVRKEQTLHHFSDAMRIAFEDLHDVELVVQACRALLDTIRGWQDWELLATTAKQLVAFGQQHDLPTVCLEAGWHMPYAYRGLGQFDRARQYAGTILARMREINEPSAICEWEEFLASLPNESHDS